MMSHLEFLDTRFSILNRILPLLEQNSQPTGALKSVLQEMS